LNPVLLGLPWLETAGLASGTRLSQQMECLSGQECAAVPGLRMNFQDQARRLFHDYRQVRQAQATPLRWG